MGGDGDDDEDEVDDDVDDNHINNYDITNTSLTCIVVTHRPP